MRAKYIPSGIVQNVFYLSAIAIAGVLGALHRQPGLLSSRKEVFSTVFPLFQVVHSNHLAGIGA